MTNNTWSRWLGQLRAACRGPGSRAHKRGDPKTGRSRLTVERLEDRAVPAALTFVNDNWHLFVDADASSSLTVGDTVTNANDIGDPLFGAIYGVSGFGTVTTAAPGIPTPASVAGAATINDAIANTDPGGTVRVLQGTYGELVNVNKSITVLGAQAGTDPRTRTGPESVVGSAGGAFQFTANDIVLDGFTVSGVTGGLNAGVHIGGGSGYQVRNNIITNNVIGVFANVAGASLIERNLFDGNNNSGPSGGAAIYSDSSASLTIDDNEFRNHTINSPIVFGATAIIAHTSLAVTDNYIHDNVSGIFALGINGGLFQGNTITTGGTEAALTFGGANTGIDVLRNDLSGNLRGLSIADYGFLGVTPNSDIEAHFNSFAGNSVYGAGVSNEGLGLTDGYTGALDLTANWWGDVTGPTSADNPGGTGSALQNDFADAIDFQPWLLYDDANATQVGFQIPTTFTVNAQTTPFTATNNDYRRLVNAFDPLQAGQTMILSGTFDWTETNAAASWALGNDGVVSAADDYSILVVPNINDVTVTAATLGAARVQGPGDLAAVNLEGFLVFDGGDNQNWTISNLEVFDFDLGIGMFNGAGGVDAFNDTTITNNRIRVPADLNATLAPADVNQNIGIHFSFGTNQTISNNQIELVASGLSDSGNSNFASVVGMQSNTSGGNAYDGLLITGNVLTVTGAQAGDPGTVLGIWENGHAHTSDITVSNNQVLNQTTGGTPATNLIRAFRVTSHSGAATTVTYSGNTVSGANIGFQWLAGQNFSGNMPVVLSGNTLTNVQTGFLVQSNGVATFTGNNVTGTPSGTGLDVRQGSKVSVLSGSFTGTGVGIDVDGTLNNSAQAVALIQGANLNNNSIAGLRLQNGAQVDAGAGGYTGLGTSTGGNDFASYLPAGPGRAIINLNTDGGFTGAFVAAPPDMRAQGNTFASPSLAFIEQVVDHDVDVATQGFVDFSSPLTGANDAPVAADGTLTTAEDTPTTGTLVATDVDSPTLTYSIVDQSGAQGVVTITNAATGAYSYTPNPNYNGPASFTFKANDGALDSNIATVSITVTAVDDAPVAVDDVVATTEDTPASGTLATNDTPSGDGGNVWALATPATNGTAVVNPNGTFTYTPNANFTGSDTFTYTITDVDGDTDTATVSITVTAVNDAPVVNNQSFTVAENSPNGTPVGSVLATDADGPALTYSITAGNTGGAFAINSTNGQITVANSAALDFETNPVFSLTVQVSDGTATDTATVTIGLSDVVEVVTPPAPAVVSTPLSLYAVGTGPGAQAQVNVYDAISGALRFTLLPYGTYTGGVTVAMGDVTGDGTPDVVTAATGHVKVFDGTNGAEVRSFFAYAGYSGEAAVAVGDLNGDAQADIVTGASINGHVKAFDGATGAEVRSFFAYAGFPGSATVAVGDVNRDGTDDIITGAGQSGHVKVFDGISGAEVRSFFAYAGFPGAVNVAAGDVNGDGWVDIITGAGAGAGPHVKVFSGADNSELASFFAYGGFDGGVRVGSADLDGDLMADILTGAGPSGGPHLKGFDGLTAAELDSFFAFDPSFTGGIFVGGK